MEVLPLSFPVTLRRRSSGCPVPVSVDPREVDVPNALCHPVRVPVEWRCTAPR